MHGLSLSFSPRRRPHSPSVVTPSYLALATIPLRPMPSSNTEEAPLLPSHVRRQSRRVKLGILLAAFATLAIVAVSITLTSKLVDSDPDGPEDPLERAHWLLKRCVDGRIDGRRCFERTRAPRLIASFCPPCMTAPGPRRPSLTATSTCPSSLA